MEYDKQLSVGADTKRICINIFRWCWHGRTFNCHLHELFRKKQMAAEVETARPARPFHGRTEDPESTGKADGDGNIN